MKKKMMYALVSLFVIIVAVVSGVGAYVLMNNSSGGKTVAVADATSLQYDVDVTYNGTTSLAKFAGENLGASDMVLRIDLSGGGQKN